MKIVTIVGARPQFIKLAPVSRILRESHKEILIHTGQHYDYNMSNVFFDELGIPKPDYNLNVGSGFHGKQTGEMLIRIEEVLIYEKPDIVIVYGDTNSTLAGALAASKLHIPVYHVEAGLRSYDKLMPEEQNRIVADHLSEKLFCPTKTAVENLAKEGITVGVYNVGDVMYDAILYNKQIAYTKSHIIDELNICPQEYILVTIHRAENTDKRERLASIFNAFNSYDGQVILPLHPRTQKYLKEYNIEVSEHIKVIEPVGYLDMLILESNAKKIATDSGGVQKEAYFLGIPCITLREETEWVETVQDGWNVIVSADKNKILDALYNFKPNGIQTNCFGDGHASEKIVALL